MCSLHLAVIVLLIVVVFEICPQFAFAGSPVKYLPGFEGPLPFHLETGYIGVGEADEVQLFYYFIKSQSNPKIDPLLYWFTGGPGCSPLSAILYELGPLEMDMRAYNGSLPTLSLNPYAYTKVANMIFVDMPVGSGFSYAATQRSIHSDDLQSGDHAYEFLRKWLIEHQEYLNNPFYVAGDSYSGITVPIVTQVISNGNDDMGIKPWINLKGYILGNPVTFSGQDYYKIPFAHGMGLISDELYKSLLVILYHKIPEDCWVRMFRCSKILLDILELNVDGDHDMVVPFGSTQSWIKSLNYSIIDDWKPWIVDGRVAGYRRSYSNQMTFATVKGGGHTASEWKPVECLAMLKRWLSHLPL